jgi:hypothetical protein
VYCNSYAKKEIKNKLFQRTREQTLLWPTVLGYSLRLYSDALAMRAERDCPDGGGSPVIHFTTLISFNQLSVDDFKVKCDTEMPSLRAN